jgi:hypothetical protein
MARRKAKKPSAHGTWKVRCTGHPGRAYNPSTGDAWDTARLKSLSPGAGTCCAYISYDSFDGKKKTRNKRIVCYVRGKSAPKHGRPRWTK